MVEADRAIYKVIHAERGVPIGRIGDFQRKIKPYPFITFNIIKPAIIMDFTHTGIKNAINRIQKHIKQFLVGVISTSVVQIIARPINTGRAIINNEATDKSLFKNKWNSVFAIPIVI